MINLELKTFIENNIDLIEQCKFDTIYSIALSDNIDVGDFTRTLLAANIDPLLNMSYVPSRYLFFGRLSDYTIPDGIDIIFPFAFTGNKFKTFVVPEGVSEIGREVFSHCLNLNSISLPKTLEFIDTKIFKNCVNLSEIIYNGSISEWNKIECMTDAFYEIDSPAVHLVCTDYKGILTI